MDGKVTDKVADGPLLPGQNPSSTMVSNPIYQRQAFAATKVGTVRSARPRCGVACAHFGAVSWHRGPRRLQSETR
jgi:hypothetical protein